MCSNMFRYRAAMHVAILLAVGSAADLKQEPFDFDVVVYGATSGGIIAAIAASRHNMSVGMIVANGGGCGPSDAGANHIGGMTTGGLGKTDIGGAADGGLIGGITLEFYSRVAKIYNTTAPPSWNHEPHVALAVYESMLNESTVDIIRGGHGANIRSATVKARRITSITLVDGRLIQARAFIDASYEGDLIAAAGASWVVGREAKSKYNESMAGRQAGDYGQNYEFKLRLNPYDDHGKPLPLLEEGPTGSPGDGDDRVQAYNFRLCTTSDPKSSAVFPRPDPSSNFAKKETWELARRFFADPNWKVAAGRTGCSGDDFPCFELESPPLNPLTGHKRDWNNPFLGPLNTDCVTGCNQSGYAEADFEGRLRIWEDHKQYYLSLLQFYGSDPHIPEEIRNKLGAWGLCADEFVETGNWPPQLYTRETRRMVGDKVFTQNTPSEHRCFGNLSIGIADYTFDSHPAQRFACFNGTDPNCKGALPAWLPSGMIENQSFAWAEGNVQLPLKPYSIPRWSITPKISELTNCLATATPSGSHVGFSSLRMEPQFMVLGHSAGTWAALYLSFSNITSAIQELDAGLLTRQLEKEGQILNPAICKL
eukprot:m.3571 g.3571  ORF g.3571 m.3571 type:complete len:595 (+) comp2789_c0_seq1:164-1948(+)